MNNQKENKLVKIYWDDAVIYGKPLTKNAFSLGKKITEGEVIREQKDFLIIKDPITLTYDKDLKKYVPFVAKKKITFFFIPVGMIKKIEQVEKINTKAKILNFFKKNTPA